MTERKTKILLVTDSAALPSGLAETTRLVFTQLLRQFPGEYELHQLGLYHCYAVTEPGWPIYPTSLSTADGTPRFDPADEYGQRTFPGLVKRLRPDIVFAFGDPHRVLHLCRPRESRNYVLILYLNFEGLPASPALGPVMNNADMIFTKTDFAKKVLLKFLPAVAPDKVDTLYSPADVTRFAPVSADQKRTLRRELFPEGLSEHAFVLGWVGRNQWRKQIWLLYKTIYHLRRGAYLTCSQCARVSLLGTPAARGAWEGGPPLVDESRPDWAGDCCVHCGSREISQAAPLLDVVLWAHMAEEPEQDWPVACLEQQFALRRGADVIYTPGYEMKGALSPSDIPTLYNLWDCLLFLSGGEGFGLPVWEAMCAGLPSVYTNYSGHAELLGKGQAGVPVGGILQPEPRSCIWRMVADVSQVIESVRRLYLGREFAARLGKNGRAFVENYPPATVASRWHAIFQRALGRGVPMSEPSTASA